MKIKLYNVHNGIWVLNLAAALRWRTPALQLLKYADYSVRDLQAAHTIR